MYSQTGKELTRAVGLRRNLYVIDAVERASKRAAAAAHKELSRGVNSLATIAATATLVGLLGTFSQIITHTFYSCAGNVNSCNAPVGGRLSEAMNLTAVGLVVSIVAFCFYKYLASQIEVFDVEMENASVDLVNRLVVHLGRLATPASDIYWSPIPVERSHELTGPPVLAPRFTLSPRFYSSGVLEVIWPRIKSELDADSVLWGGQWISFFYAFLGWLPFYLLRRPGGGILVFLFLVVAGFGVRVGSVGSVLSVFGFFAFASVACARSYSWSLLCVAVTPILLIGSLRAARFLAATGKSTMPLLLRMSLVALGFSVAVVILFGTVFALYPVRTSSSMEPAVRVGDRVIGVNGRWMGTIHRGDLVLFEWGRIERVVGLPGDRIRVESGTLIRNGNIVIEPSLKRPYTELCGDFPLPTAAVPDALIRCESQRSFPTHLTTGTDFTVPEGSYFLLNDNRNELEDSRYFGPIPESELVGRPVLAFGSKSHWLSPRVIH